MVDSRPMFFTQRPFAFSGFSSWNISLFFAFYHESLLAESPASVRHHTLYKAHSRPFSGLGQGTALYHLVAFILWSESLVLLVMTCLLSHQAVNSLDRDCNFRNSQLIVENLHLIRCNKIKICRIKVRTNKWAPHHDPTLLTSLKLLI